MLIGTAAVYDVEHRGPFCSFGSADIVGDCFDQRSQRRVTQASRQVFPNGNLDWERIGEVSYGFLIPWRAARKPDSKGLVFIVVGSAVHFDKKPDKGDSHTKPRGFVEVSPHREFLSAAFSGIIGDRGICQTYFFRKASPILKTAIVS